MGQMHYESNYRHNQLIFHQIIGIIIKSNVLIVI